ncbi:MAG: phosphonate C-P lyase system protein PhnH [Leptolyngbya foveolarum]|uniref:Phosphonate C-P lyase system protein PhnH n=1 Tax=Leptolyngbya foveolarum TaxID=47253 RepID=A0A2W4TZ76_9CYAN|nr:MAG: phosphonate C-P lyase system protein PhnH [Leptolyngbya foveolarum]
MTTTLPGFRDPVHDAQQTFRGLLEALAHPGQAYTLNLTFSSPEGLTPICAAACLTLLDLETTVWLQPSLPATVKDWLCFHTGCRFTDNPELATFAVIGDAFSQPELRAFNWGSAEDPEQSTTLLIQVNSFTSGVVQQLSGAGVLGSMSFAPSLPETFWTQRRSDAYPQGVDCFLLSQQSVVGLPRTVRSSQLLVA